MKPGITIISFLTAFTLLLSASFDSIAQVKCKIDSIRAFSSEAGIWVHVVDSLTKEPLAGAIVMLYDGRDTLKMQTGNSGVISFVGRNLAADSLSVSASMLGYRERMARVKIDRRYRCSIYVGLAEDPMELTSIVVTGDAVAMVMHGDTTVFNSAAFSSMKGDVLRDLLKKFPGVEVSSGGITYKGKKIDRILVNGTTLFGKDMASAMDMVLADEVKSVKVYDRDAEDDLLRDGTEAREHVMDVRTWNPMEHIGQLKLEAEAGVFTGGHELEAGGAISLGDFDIGARPRISANILGSHNHDVPTPSDMLHANVSVGKNAPGKYGYNTIFLANINGGSTSSGDVTSYLPSYAWNERSDTSSSYSSRKSGLFSLNHTDYRKLGKAVYKASYSLSFGRNTSSGRTLHSSVQDNVRTEFNKASGDTVSNVSLSLAPNFTIPFVKRRRSLTITPNLSLDRSSGSGARLDTMKMSMAPEWLTNTLYSSNASPSLTVLWREPLGKKSTLTFAARTSYNYGKVRKLYFDELSGSPDLNNTRDFTTDNITGEMTAGYAYGRRNGDGLYLSATAGVRDMAVRRDEKSGNVKDWKGNYLRPVIGAQAAWSKGVHELMLEYKESETLPAVEQLRNTVDDTNPLSLYAGNPGLRMSVARNLAASYGVSVMDRGISLSMSLNATVTSGVISSKKTYFTEDTFFPELNYTVRKGSSLTMPVNMPEEYRMSGNIAYCQYFSRPKLTLGLYVQAYISDSPFYIADELMRNSFSMMDVSVVLSKDTGTSSIFFTAGADLAQNRCTGVLIDRSVRPVIQLNYRQRIGNHFELDTVNIFSWMFSENGADYSDLDCRLKLSWIFGKDSRCRAAVYGNNLIDSYSGHENIVEADYIRSSWKRYLGRSVGLSFTYVFSRR